MYRIQGFNYLSAAFVLAAAVFPAVAMAEDNGAPWIKTNQELILLSANDGQAHLRLNNRMQIETKHQTADSFTVISLGPTHPPDVRTIYGTVPSSVIGPPYIAVSDHGRFGFIVSNGAGIFNPEKKNLLSVIDLQSATLAVMQKVEIPGPWMAALHPDGKHLIVPCATGFQVFEIRNSGITLIKDNKIGRAVQALDINSAGDLIIATVTEPNGRDFSRVALFNYHDGTIENRAEVKTGPDLPQFDRPWTPRITPDGKRALIANGGGWGSKGTLDDVLSVDLTAAQPTVTEALRQVGDGIESLAIHPSGRMAVIACLEELPPFAHNTYSHLAVADLTSKPLRILYELDVEAVPEGIAFTPDGAQLFVQFTSANHIAVFDVDRFMLTRSPFVIRTGNGPSSMALGAK
jgi:DNA-binding beta-propeller fold protein YncE